MKKIVLLTLTVVLISLKPGLTQRAYKLTVNQPPPLSITIAEEVDGTVGEMVNLDSWFHVEGSGIYTRIWKFNDGSMVQPIDNPEYTIQGSGKFYLTVTNEYGCTALDSIVLNIVTGIDDINYERDKSHSIRIYPNPNTGEFDVVISDCQPGYYLELLNSAGVQILSGILQCNNNDYMGTIKVPSVDPGIYFLLVKLTGKLIFRQKVIILK